nr:hypothetical protein CFP56_28686 [Quercus suber]
MSVCYQPLKLYRTTVNFGQNHRMMGEAYITPVQRPRPLFTSVIDVNSTQCLWKKAGENSPQICCCMWRYRIVTAFRSIATSAPSLAPVWSRLQPIAFDYCIRSRKQCNELGCGAMTDKVNSETSDCNGSSCSSCGLPAYTAGIAHIQHEFAPSNATRYSLQTGVPTHALSVQQAATHD